MVVGTRLVMPNHIGVRGNVNPHVECIIIIARVARLFLPRIHVYINLSI